VYDVARFITSQFNYVMFGEYHVKAVVGRKVAGQIGPKQIVSNEIGPSHIAPPPLSIRIIRIYIKNEIHITDIDYQSFYFKGIRFLFDFVVLHCLFNL
jgi:hypothetical protein